MERPKVRFSQYFNDENCRQTEEMKVVSDKSKVKIKSIVPIKFPIKILKNQKQVEIKNQKGGNEKLESKDSLTSTVISKSDESLIKTESNKSLEISIGESFVESKCVKATESKSNSDSCEIKKYDHNFQMLIDDSTNQTDVSSRIKDKQNEFDKHTSTVISNNKNFPVSICDNNDDNYVEVIKVINNSSKANSFKRDNKQSQVNSNTSSNKSNNCKSVNKSKNISNRTKINQISQKGKENYSERIATDLVKNKLSSNTVSVLKDANNASIKKSENISSRSINNKKKLQLMPCAKFRLQSLTQNKSKNKQSKSQVKKTAVFHVSGNHCSVSVEPGVSHNCNVNDELTESYDRKNIASKDLLSRPEYNSITDVMKKLKEIEKEKLVLNFEHMPQEYKNLLYGKASTALDFPPYESVYKDLINLSIDDNKLPARLMRSKDPEPRNKDIVPKLSDFYNPKYTEQYFVIANPTILNPVNVNTLNAFTVSNKICTWKMCRDNV